MNRTYDFKDQVALMTGASSGMSLASGQAFAEAGAAVLLADIDASYSAPVPAKPRRAGRLAVPS